jgi:acetoin utilization deacetylase AcuC-like enzyme
MPVTPKFFNPLEDEDAWTCINCAHQDNFGGNDHCAACSQPRQKFPSFTATGEQPDLTVFTLNKDQSFASWPRPKPVITGYCYDSIMEKHEAESVSKNGILDVHVERPDRVRCVNQHLGAQGLLDRMVKVPSRWATQAEICCVHSPELFAELKSTHGKSYIRITGFSHSFEDGFNGLYEASSKYTSGGKPIYCHIIHDGFHDSHRIEHNSADGEWQIKRESLILKHTSDGPVAESGTAIVARIACSGSLESCAALDSWIVLDDICDVDDLSSVPTYVPLPSMRLRIDRSKTGCSRDDTSIDSNTYVGPHSFQAAVMAVGCVLNVAHAVVTGRITNGIAVVRPPGHHAKKGASQGFCLLNNVAIAAKVATTTWDVDRVVILDWDIHHGNGTEEIFYDDPNVLVINMHRFDNRAFYPGTGSPDRIGVGEGKGFNINIGWQTGDEGGMSDSDYLAAIRVIVLPILEQFKPGLLFISAGFDAAMGDPLGRCKVTCAGYAQMTQLLSSACNGKVVVVIEGGYNLTAVANSSEAVVIAHILDSVTIHYSNSQTGPYVAWTACTHHSPARHQTGSWPGSPRNHAAPRFTLELLVSHQSHHEIAIAA